MNQKESNYILLTGGTGFLGSHILRAFLYKNKKIILLKRKKSSLWRIADLNNKYISYDVDKVDINKIFMKYKIDTVIHTACIYGKNLEPSSEVVNSNLTFGLKLLEAAIENRANYQNLNKDVFSALVDFDLTNVRTPRQ